MADLGLEGTCAGLISARDLQVDLCGSQRLIDSHASELATEDFGKHSKEPVRRHREPTASDGTAEELPITRHSAHHDPQAPGGRRNRAPDPMRLPPWRPLAMQR